VVEAALLVREDAQLRRLRRQPARLLETIPLSDAEEHDEPRPDCAYRLAFNANRGAGDALEDGPHAVILSGKSAVRRARAKDLFGTRSVPWRPILTEVVAATQVVLLLVGLAYSVVVAYRIARQQTASEAQAWRGTLPVSGFLCAVTLTFLWLYLG